MTKTRFLNTSGAWNKRMSGNRSTDKGLTVFFYMLRSVFIGCIKAGSTNEVIIPQVMDGAKGMNLGVNLSGWKIL